jgi:hypothetical protein
MPAAYSDIYLEQGTTYTNQITLDDSNGLSYDLNSFTASSQAKKSYYSANVILQLNATISDPANGIITISANAATTSTLPTGKLVYDVIITDTTNGNVSRVLEGQIFVAPGVTNVTAIAPGSPPNTNSMENSDE